MAGLTQRGDIFYIKGIENDKVGGGERTDRQWWSAIMRTIDIVIALRLYISQRNQRQICRHM